MVREADAADYNPKTCCNFLGWLVWVDTAMGPNAQHVLDTGDVLARDILTLACSGYSTLTIPHVFDVIFATLTRHSCSELRHFMLL